jgi:hypothetical protein
MLLLLVRVSFLRRVSWHRAYIRPNSDGKSHRVCGNQDSLSTGKPRSQGGSQILMVRLKGLNLIKGIVFQDRLYVIQFKIQFPKEHDLLQPQNLFFFVISVAVFPIKRRLEQSNFIIVVEGAHTDARHAGHFFHGVWDCQVLR